MKLHRYLLLAGLSLFLLVPSAHGQETFDDVKQGFFQRYNYGASRLAQLAEVLPEETFDWKPNEGAMSMERVFMHIIRYNYLYPESALGIASPEGIEVDNLEEMTGKETVLAHLQDSFDHVRNALEGMSDEELHQKVEFYGSETQAINVFLQLQAHMAEHVGQLLAYSRMNDVVPPWSR